MDLKKLIDYIKDELQGSFGNNLNTLIKLAAAGDLPSKNTLKCSIKKHLTKFLKSDKEGRIEDYIKQYHVDYFHEIYTGNTPHFKDILNSICIVPESSYEDKIDLLTQIIYQELYGLSVIDPYSYGKFEGLNEINMNSKDFISFEIFGKSERIKSLFFKDKIKYEDVINKAVSPSDSTNDLKPDNPEVLCMRMNDVRASALIPPYVRESSLNLRFEDSHYFNPEYLVENGTSTRLMEDFTNIIMKGRPNIFVIGPQNVGKTSYILRLISSIPDYMKLLTIESTFELNIPKYFPGKDVKNLKFFNGKTPSDCFRTALRLNRDIIIDGEVRIPEEAYVTLQSMTRENKGSMGSFHVASINQFVDDYKNMLMKTGIYTKEETAIYDIARAVNILILMHKDNITGTRYIKNVSELIFNSSNEKRPYIINTLFEYNLDKKELLPVNRISESFIKEAFDFGFTLKDHKELCTLYDSNNVPKAVIDID